MSLVQETLLDLPNMELILPHPRNQVIFVEGTPLLINPATGNWLRLSESGCRLYRLLSMPQAVNSNYTDDAQLLHSISSKQIKAFIQSLRDGLFISADQGRPEVYSIDNGSIGCYPIDRYGIKSKGSKGIPENCLLNVTNLCNLRCEHCAVYSQTERNSNLHTAEISKSNQVRGEGKRMDNGDYPFAQIAGIIDRLASLKVSYLVLFGGEPLIRKDISDIIRYASSKISKVGLTTNGTLLSPELCQVVADCISDVQVSLDGSCPEINDPIRGRHSFARTLEGIYMLRNKGFGKIFIKTVITQKNIYDIPNMVKLARKMKVNLELNFFLPLGRGGTHKDTLRVDPSRLITVFKNVWLLADYYGLESASFNTICEKWIGRAADNCGAGFGSMLVDCSGDVYPCESLQHYPFRMGNLLADKTFQSKPLTTTLNCSVDNLPECSKCDVRYFCRGGCAAEAYTFGLREHATSTMCGFYRAILPGIVARWERNLSSWQNLKRVFGGGIDFSQVREYLSE